MTFENTTISDFQAEYEGSIPFTRSISDFNDLLKSLRPSFQGHSVTLRTSKAEAKKNLRVFSISTLGCFMCGYYP
jgi:hypothetical protein